MAVKLNHKRLNHKKLRSTDAVLRGRLKVYGKRPAVPYGHQTIDSEDIAAVVEALGSDWLTQGPRVREFEDVFAAYVGSQYAVAVNSGTAALHLACLAAGLGPGDEVVTSPMTFVATANCAFYVGARPAFVDIDPATFNLDPGRLEEYLQKRSPRTVHRSRSKGRATGNRRLQADRSRDIIPRAVIPVHFAGLPCNMSEIHRIARQHHLIIIEDACHALGAKYRVGHGADSQWISVGSCVHSDMTVFSFHPVKHITTGEGGMITTNDRDLYEKLLLLRSHGITRSCEEFTVDRSQFTVKSSSDTAVGERTTDNDEHLVPSWYYEMQTLGYNYRMTDIHAALGTSQLKKIGAFVDRRRFIAGQYSRMITELGGFRHQTEPDGYQSSYHLYTILTDDEARMTRDEVMADLKRMGVCTQVHYIPVYRHPFYQRMGFGCDSWPNAEHFFRHCLSIPMFPGMSAEDVQHVSSALQKVGRRL